MKLNSITVVIVFVATTMFFAWRRLSKQGVKNFPIITFLQRTWMLFIAALAFNWLSLTEHTFKIFGTWELDEMKGGIWVAHTPFQALGSILYMPPKTLVAFILSLLVIHLLYRETIDASVNSGKYKKAWDQLTPEQEVKYTTQTRIGIFIGICILCASL